MINKFVLDENQKLLPPIDQQSIWLFGKPVKDLCDAEEIDLYEYIDDLKHPEWRPVYVNGIKTHYIVSNTGVIVNTETKNRLVYSVDKDGYFRCRLSVNGSPKHTGVHRVVASAFIPNPENKPQVNHMNTNKQCNWYQNLEWCTNKENIEHARSMGLEDHLGRRGEENNKNIYSEEQIRKACKMMEDPNNRPYYISKVTGVSKIGLYNLRHGNIWTHITKDYHFPEKNFRIGENSINAKYTENQIREICKRLEKGIAPGKISKELGVHDMLVQSIRKGRAWTHISKNYKFPEINYKFGEQKVQAKYTEAQIRKACELLTNPKLNFEDIARETGVHKDTIFRITKGTHWSEISKDYDFSNRLNAKKAAEDEKNQIIELYKEGKPFGEIYDIMKSKYGMADHPRGVYHLYDVVKVYKKSNKS